MESERTEITDRAAAYARIAENVAAVRANIDAALRRRRAEVTTPVSILLATKTVPPDEILYAADELGLRLIGENRVQELNEKYEALEGHGIERHFIGHLQANKVRQLAGRVTMVESVDCEAIARELDRRSGMLGITTDVLLEVNSGREPNKSGFFPEDVPAGVAAIRAFPHLRLCGMMTMAPVGTEKEAYRKFFRETYQLFIDFLPEILDNIGDKRQPVLSMGMSDSYEVAVEEGATEVRLGQAVFGKRVYPAKN